MNDQFLRTEMLLGKQAMEKLQKLGADMGLEDFLNE